MEIQYWLELSSPIRVYRRLCKQLGIVPEESCGISHRLWQHKAVGAMDWEKIEEWLDQWERLDRAKTYHVKLKIHYSSQRVPVGLEIPAMISVRLAQLHIGLQVANPCPSPVIQELPVEICDICIEPPLHPLDTGHVWVSLSDNTLWETPLSPHVLAYAAVKSMKSLSKKVIPKPAFPFIPASFTEEDIEAAVSQELLKGTFEQAFTQVGGHVEEAQLMGPRLTFQILYDQKQEAAVAALVPAFSGRAVHRAGIWWVTEEFKQGALDSHLRTWLTAAQPLLNQLRAEGVHRNDLSLSGIVPANQAPYWYLSPLAMQLLADEALNFTGHLYPQVQYLRQLDM